VAVARFDGVANDIIRYICWAGNGINTLYRLEMITAAIDDMTLRRRNLRLVHTCDLLSSVYMFYVRSHVAQTVEHEISIPPTIAEHWDLVTRLHAKSGVHVELHGRSCLCEGLGLGTGEVSCYLPGANNCLHVNTPIF
jgi:hypothetical protein